MATLEKFRLLATQCGVAPSPTRSPATSPLVHVPRQKTTLRALFSRNPGPRGRDKAPRPRKFGPPESSGGGGGSRATLKDLFGLPTSFEESDPEVGGRKRDGGGDGMVMVGGGNRGLLGPGSPRGGFMGMRYRGLLRKAWRPMLETIQE